MEARYTSLLAAGDKSAAAAELASFTDGVVAAAGALLERLAKDAAAALGYNDGLPPDEALAGALEWASLVWFPPRD